MKWILMLLVLSSCGTAKDVYVDNKYDLCRRACELKYSKYDYKGKSTCLSRCTQKRSEDAAK